MHEKKIYFLKKTSYREGAQEVRSKCTRGKPCQSVLT